MARSSRARARELAARAGSIRLRHAALESPPAPRLVPPEGFGVLAEIKFASPAAGRLAEPASPRAAAARARCYRRAGAAALSVLTEPTSFAGSLEHLAAAAAASGLPVLRKDFPVDPLQVYEARLAGASGVLCVLRMLDDASLAELLGAAGECGLFVLLEAFDQDDLERARALSEDAAGLDLFVGLNARNLATLKVEPGRLQRLARFLPRGVPCVAESGIDGPRDARAAARSGYALALVGSSLMHASDPGAHLRALLTAAREEVAR
jgi:indole-3-glycerol phosphate synthase